MLVQRKSLKFLLLKMLFIRLITSINSYACSCDRLPDVSEAAKSSELIYTGQVVSIKLFHQRRLPVEYVVEFVVDKVFKGKQTKYIKLRNASAGACGFPFKVNERYLVYSSKYKGKFGASKCNGTKHLSKSSVDIRRLSCVYMFGRLEYGYPALGKEMLSGHYCSG